MSRHVSTIKIFGVGTVSVFTNSVAAIDIPEDGEIVAIVGTVQGMGMGADDTATAELSFLSTNQIDTNDARGSILEVSTRTGAVSTNGQAKSSDNIALSIPDGLPVNAGERVHLHTRGSAAVTPEGVFTLYLRTTGGGRRVGRRR